MKQALEYKSFQSSCSFKNKANKFSYSHIFRQNETNELYKQEKGKRKVKNSVAVFVDVPVLAGVGRDLICCAEGCVGRGEKRNNYDQF